MFKERIKAYRAGLGLSQEAFGNLTGFSKLQILRWENGQNEPQANTITQLSERLNVTAAYLLGLTDDPKASIDEASLSPVERLILAAQRARDANDALNRAIEAVIGDAQRKHQTGDK